MMRAGIFFLSHQLHTAILVVRKTKTYAFRTSAEVVRNWCARIEVKR